MPRREKASWIALLKNAPSTFWHVSLVQFFCWAPSSTCGLTPRRHCRDRVAHHDAHSEVYQVAGNWVGVLYAVQAMGSVVWAVVLSQIKNAKLAYSLSLLLGGLGFALIPFVADQYMQFVPFLLIGCAWAAMLAMPFSFVTNALQGYGHMGAYLGLFNCAICLPQIVAAATGGFVLKAVGGSQSSMMIAAGVFLALGACCVALIKGK